MTLAFHRFVRAHLPELVDLWVEAWTAALPVIDFEARRGWIVDRLNALADEGAEIWLAFDDATGRLAGFVTIDPARAYLDQLAVAHVDWGRGVAKALLAQARTVSPDRIELHVNEDNPRAIRFYEREGFRCIGRGVSTASGLPILHYEWRKTG